MKDNKDCSCATVISLRRVAMASRAFATIEAAEASPVNGASGSSVSLQTSSESAP